MKTFHLHFEGQVQGVGFRPYVFHLAHQYGLKGWVSNGMDGVHILATGQEKKIIDFYDNLIKNPPRHAIIKKATIREESEKAFSEFKIIDSSPTGKTTVSLTPDLGICPACKKELWDAENRRFQYPFITCLHCGPRYSIIENLPYDRPLTSMKQFTMCSDCSSEYLNPGDKRFYSQTNSCGQCPVSLSWHDGNGRLLSERPHEIFEKAVQALNQGKIIAVKGIGGFLLMVDATNRRAIRKLRKRKSRPSKPFALLYPGESELQDDVVTTPPGLEAWRSIESPIVLFRLKAHPRSGIVPHLIAPGLDSIGTMQPYAPVLELLAKKFGKPLVATSGNMNGFPIFHENEMALKSLKKVVDYFLINDRRIVVPQDDSVVVFSEKENQRILLRRSRGYAPNYFSTEPQKNDLSLLCMGAMLKSTFSIQHEGQIYISQYLGNTLNYDVQIAYKKVIRHLMDVLKFQPDYLVTDTHPDYFSSRYGELLADKFGIPLVKVQHHKAHFAAVLAENDLLDSADPVLGVIWDGTGLGDDGNIWGGEFFTFRNKAFYRAAHFDYFNHVMGDKMAREPRLSALSMACQIPEAAAILPHKFTSIEWDFYTKYLSKQDVLKSSSVGRLFDCVASLLGVCDIQTFEGEAAMKLQVIAQKFYRKNDKILTAYPVSGLSSKNIVEGVVRDLSKGLPEEEIAAKFHYTLVRLIRKTAEKLQIKKIAFSGGVFQNTLLIDLAIAELKNDYQLYFHQQLSPNDENIAFGQLIYATMENNVIKKKMPCALPFPEK